MKLRILIFIFLTSCLTTEQFLAQNSINALFFNGKNFELQYFLNNGIKEELVLNDSNGNRFRNTPYIETTLSVEKNQLESSISGYCNGTSASYLVYDNYLEVLERGGTTLSDCGGDEGTDYFTPITGNIYLEQPAKKVYYSISDDKKGFMLWTDEIHKLVFEERVLSVEENEFGKAITIYPNPIKNSISIKLNELKFKIREISVLDFKGSIILKKQTDFNEIDASKLSSGIYFLKLETENNISVTKKVIKE